VGGVGAERRQRRHSVRRVGRASSAPLGCLGRRKILPNLGRLSQTTMTTWQNILGVAAIGTERQRLTLPPSDSLLGRALKGLDVSDREGTLLAAVALASLHRQAGLGAATDSLPPPEP